MAEEEDEQGVYLMESYFHPRVTPINLGGIVKEVLKWCGEQLPVEDDMSLPELKKLISERLAKAKAGQEGVPPTIRSRLGLVHMLFPAELRFKFLPKGQKDSGDKIHRPAGVAVINNIELDTTAAGT
jgi:hypothetical protein